MGNEFKILFFIFLLVTTDYWSHTLLYTLMVMHMDFWIYRKCFNENIFVYLYICVNLSIKYNYKYCNIYSLVSTES